MSDNAGAGGGLDCVIAIPCFQESTRLPSFLRQLCEELRGSSSRVRIQVVDDGSGDLEARALSEVVAVLDDEHPGLLLPPLLLPGNRGKGGAVYAGWQAALSHQPRALALVDADGSVPATEVRRIVETFLAPDASARHAIFGSRVKILGRNVTRHLHRHLLGRIFATGVTMTTGVEIYDSQCGLKILRTEDFQRISGRLRETGFVFDVELALALLQSGCKVWELPIDWHEVPGSKVHLLRDSVRMFRGLLRIRAHHGRYRSPAAGLNERV